MNFLVAPCHWFGEDSSFTCEQNLPLTKKYPLFIKKNRIGNLTYFFYFSPKRTTNTCLFPSLPSYLQSKSGFFNSPSYFFLLPNLSTFPRKHPKRVYQKKEKNGSSSTNLFVVSVIKQKKTNIKTSSYDRTFSTIQFYFTQPFKRKNQQRKGRGIMPFNFSEFLLQNRKKGAMLKLKLKNLTII